MPYYRVTDERYGRDPGPFFADSKEEFADEMLPTFRIWAKEQFLYAENLDPKTTLSEFAARAVEGMKKEFIACLEETSK